MTELDESVESLPGYDLKIIQKKKGYRYSVDALLLAEFAKVSSRETIIDLGTGVGVVPLILAKRVGSARIVAVEVQPGLGELAAANVRLNKLEDRIRVINQDIRNLKADFKAESFDLAVSNPPFRPSGTGRLSPKEEKALAKHELAITLPEIISMASYLLKHGGRLALIYTAIRMADLFWELRSARLEPKRLQFVHHRINKPARLFLVEASKGGGVELKVLAPKVIVGEPTFSGGRGPTLVGTLPLTPPNPL